MALRPYDDSTVAATYIRTCRSVGNTVMNIQNWRTILSSAVPGPKMRLFVYHEVYMPSERNRRCC